MKKKSGFTIVELLIGMAVTMVALAAAFLMFRDSTKANTNITQTSGMSDNMRAGLNLIVQDLIQTGTGIPTGGISIPNSAATKGCNKGAQLLNRPPAVLKVTFDGPNSANKGCNVILPAIEPGNGLGPIVTSPDGTSGPATDIITIMYADNTLAMDQKPIISTTTTPPCKGTIAPDGSKITFDPACVTIGAAGIPVNTGDLLMIFNGNNPNGVLQYVSDVSGQVLTFSAGDPFNLNGRAASEDSGTILTLQNLTAGKPDGTYPPTSCSRVWMITYFLDATTDPKHPMLMRAVNFNTPQPVGETIENLQFAYNFADGTTPAPVNQLTVPTGDNENQIRSVNVSLSARSATTAATTGKYIRTNLATQVALRSMAYFNAFR
jgi:type II secretory pathway pseudopilin PulG